MQKGLIIRSGVSINAAWVDRMVIDQVPMAVVPASVTSTLSAGGSLINSTTYFYKVCAIGINGEGTASVETSKTATVANKTITIGWTAQTYVKEYRVYRGTSTGVYDGYFRVFTNSFVDNGALSMVTNNGTVPTVANPQQGIALGGAYVGNGLRDYVNFGEITVEGNLYMPAIDDGVNIIPEQSYIYLKKAEKMIMPINLADVIVPSTWNTPGSDSGSEQALTDIQSWVTLA